MSIYKDCDVRGIYGKELTARDAYGIGRGLATLAPGKFLVGGDVRLSTPELKEELLRGLLDSGANPVDLGTIPTPVLYFALKRSGAGAGATVTASHNPPEYNGIKFMIGSQPVTRAIMDKLQSLVALNEFATGSGHLSHWDIIPEYLDSLATRFHASRPLHVLVDAGCGAMGNVAPQAFRQAGYRVTELSCVPNGAFPDRSPNPADYSCLGQTCQAVREAGADFGVAFDGDGDRAVFIDETGVPVQNEKSLVLFIRSLLRSRPTPVVYDQKSSSIIRDAVLEMGGTPLPERSGHAFIKKRFLENGAALAGEVSGHFFFGELGYDDGLFAALLMAELIASGNESLGSLVGKIQCPPITPDIRIPCPYDQQQSWLDAAEKMADSEGAQISHLDGVRAEFQNGWFLLRKSVTAEQITLRAEARSAAQLKELLSRLCSVLPNTVRSVLVDINLLDK